jgi:putative peptidoglycan lipid II flippase
MKLPGRTRSNGPPPGEEPDADVATVLPRGTGSWSRIGRATLGISLIALLAKALGFGEKLVVAYYFGASCEVDAYFVAVSVPTLFFLFAREMIEAPFLPIFVQNLRRDAETRAWRFFSFVALGLFLLGSGFSLFAWLTSDGFSARLAPGFDAAALETTSGLLRVLAPASALLSLSALTFITLNAYQRFAWPASGDLAWKLGPLLTCLLLVERLGVLALAVGYLLGSGARLAVHLAGLRRHVSRLGWPRAGEREDFRLFGMLLLPLVLGAVLAQVSEIADNYFSSLIGEGGVAAKTFAKKLRDLPLEVLPATLSIVLLPHFAVLHADGQHERLHGLLGQTVRGLAWSFALVGVLLFALAGPVVSLALERGAFDAVARDATAYVLQFYALGMVTFAVEGPIVNFFFASRDTRTPILAGVLHVVLNIALCATLIRPLGVAGVALALTLSKSTKVVVLLALLRRRGYSGKRAALTREALVLLGAVAAAFGGVQLYRLALGAPQPGGPLVELAAHTAGACVAGTLLFLGCVLLLGRRERDALVRSLQRLGKTGQSS